MKYTLYIVYTLAALSFLTGCDDASPYMSPDWKLSVNSRYLSIDKAEFSFGADQNLSQQLRVSSVATGWTLNAADAWIKATPANGNSDAEVTLTATENKSGDDIRTTIMTFASAKSDYNYSRPISITQSRANAYIHPDTETLTFTRDASSQTIPISTNTKWQATSSETWVSVAPTEEGNSLVVTVEENEYTTERTAQITLKGNTTTTIFVKQSGSTFDNLVASLMFGNKADSQEVQVETNGKWTASTKYDWISLSPMSGSGLSKLKISVSDNPEESERAGIVIVKVGNTEKQVMLTQLGTYFTVNTIATDAIPSTGGSHAVSFTSSDSWTAESNSSWATLVPPSGQPGTSVVTIKAENNASIHARFDTTFIVIDNAYLSPYRIITRQDGRYITVSTSELEFYKDAASKTFTVTTDGKFEAKTDAEWLQCTKNGNSVKVTATDNTDPLPRTATIVVRLTDVPTTEQTESEQRITVTQQGEGWKLDVDKLNLSTGSDAASLSFSIMSNDDWTAQSSVDWATLSSTQGHGNKTITVSFSANGQAEKRNGIITVKADHVDTPATINIGQSGIGYYLDLSADSIIATSAAEEKAFAITSNDVWTVITSAPAWATVSPDYGSGDGSVKVKFQANSNPEDRTGAITVSGNNSAPKTIGMRQQGVGYHLSVSPNSLTADSKAVNKSITITSNDSWTITPSVSWISVSPSSGSGNQNITVSISASNEAESRNGEIVVAGVKGKQSATVDVVQSGIGYYLEVDKTEMSMGSEASSSVFNISSNDSWTVTSSEPWATVVPSSGTGDKTITVSCAKNETNAPRTCNLTVKGSRSQTVTIRLTQQGYNLTVDTHEISVGSSSASRNFTITSNDSWTVSSSVSWATVNTTSGSGNHTVSVSFSANTGPEVRSGYITITGSNTSAVTIVLTQAGVGYHLYVDNNDIAIGAAASTVSFTITSNDTWSLSTLASWVKLSSTSGSANKTITVEIERNTNAEERETTISVRGNKSGLTETVRLKQAKGGQNDITIDDFEDPKPLN